MSDIQRNLVNSAPGAVADVPLGVFHLLAIGIDRYSHWNPLKTAVRGAEAVAELLERDYGFAGVTKLLNAEATLPRIIGELRRLADSLTPDDSLLVYFAGHGHLDTLTKSGAWVPVDGRTPANAKDHSAASSWIESHTVKSILRACKARHILLVSDSCFAGDFVRSHRDAPPVITDAYVRKAFALASRQVLTSGGLEPVSDGGADDHSVFTGFLLRGLREHSEPYLLPSQLHDRVKGGVAENAPQLPVLGTLHETAGEVGGEFVLFRKGHATLEEALARQREKLSALEQAEADARRTREEQQREIAAREAEAAELNRKIKELELRLGSSGASAGSASLDHLLALLAQREREAVEMESLRRKAEEDRQRREAEIARLRAEDLERRRRAFADDWAKYQKVINHPQANDAIRQSAWQSICRDWHIDSPVPKNLEWRDNEVRVVAASAPPSSPEAEKIDLKGSPAASGISIILDRLTPGALWMLANAREAAARFKHNFIGTEHLLLAIIIYEKGTAGTVLARLRNLSQFRLDLIDKMPPGQSELPLGKIIYTPRLKKVLALASKEASSLNHSYVGIEHLLLGLVREGDGLAARALADIDLRLEDLRREIVKELNSPSASLTESSGATDLAVLEDKLEHANVQKQEAISKQDFESASRCRDEAKRIRDQINVVRAGQAERAEAAAQSEDFSGEAPSNHGHPAVQFKSDTILNYVGGHKPSISPSGAVGPDAGETRYRVRGSDQKEYGPVTASVVRDWIRQNRVRHSTLACAEGEAVWTLLEEMPPFAELFSTSESGASSPQKSAVSASHTTFRVGESETPKSKNLDSIRAGGPSPKPAKTESQPNDYGFAAMFFGLVAFACGACAFLSPLWYWLTLEGVFGSLFGLMAFAMGIDEPRDRSQHNVGRLLAFVGMAFFFWQLWKYNS